MNDNLGVLFDTYGSDKNINGYTPLYTQLFRHLREEPIRFLEVGIGTMIPDVPSSMVGYAQPHYTPGGSLRAWRDYFPNAEIFGFDIQPDTQISGEERIRTFLCDSTQKEQVNKTIPFHNVFDIIIDDGSHYHEHQLQTLENLYPLLKTGGVYIIEDIQEWSELLQRPHLIREKVGHDLFFFVGLKNNQCVVLKPHTKKVT